VKRTLFIMPGAVAALRKIDRRFMPAVWQTLDRLVEEPDAMPLQPDEDDPSFYWLALEGDIIIRFEILDEKHAICVLDIGQ
jgi:hypothetical protein